MAVTASRLGSSPLLVDWTHLISVPPGQRSYQPSPNELLSFWKTLTARFESGEVGFYQTPTLDAFSQAEASKKLATSVLGEGFTDCLILGIGGSSLGPMSWLAAQKAQAQRSSMRIHIAENPDPDDFSLTLAGLLPEKTLVCVITKSGGTFETISQFMIALNWLGKPRWKSHIVAITDPEKGDLRKFALSEGIRTLDIHPSLGGRFSIFSPVGLFPAYLAGLSVPDFLAGAKQVKDYCDKTVPEKNPLFLIGDQLIQHFSKRPIHVCMPYTTQLRTLGNWWVQLWGESLGKDRKGFTPVAAVGAIDQHSILQLLRDGPDDKVTWFITLNQFQNKVVIPKIPTTDPKTLPSFQLLANHSLDVLLQTEYQATARVLSNQNRPHYSIQMESINERSLGALYFSLSVMTAMTGTIWGVNPFDQPGVEEGKVYTREALITQKREQWDQQTSNETHRLRLGTSKVESSDYE